jgi:hypothetical protein
MTRGGTACLSRQARDRLPELGGSSTLVGVVQPRSEDHRGAGAAGKPRGAERRSQASMRPRRWSLSQPSGSRAETSAWGT